jgi:anti-repressor protein
MNELMLFNNDEFGEIRGVEIEGKPYVVATDIAKALGYLRPNDAINQHCKYTVKHRIPHPQSKTKTIEVNIIPEGDVYRLIIKSKLPSAQKFEEWVMDEVLPSLRKTGKYEIQTDSELPQLLNDMTQLVEDMGDRIEEQDKQIEEIKHLVGIRAKDVFDYGKIIKEHLGISKGAILWGRK